MHRKTKEIREAEAELKRKGFVHVSTNGSHYKYVNRNTNEHISLPIHTNKMLKKREWKKHGIS